jgi:site-specific recombinase XerD
VLSHSILFLYAFLLLVVAFASWLVMNGVPLFEVSKLLRHSSIQMTERYAHLGPDHLHNAVANLGFSAH